MSFITFDITYKKRTDFEALKMLMDSEFNQLKLIICGKYKIYDLPSCYIYYNNDLLNYPEKTKLKDIFHKKKIKLTIQTEKQILTNRQSSLLSSISLPKYLCKCKSAAKYICDKCDEFLCESCSKRSKHNIHIDKVIKIEEYSSYIKNYLHKSAIELDEKITKDEAYKYFCYWHYDLTNELSAINHCYEFAKKELEDIKQIQTDTLISLSNTTRFSNFTSDIENLILSYGNINTQENLSEIIIDKAKLINESNEMIRQFGELKQAVLCYHNTLRDIQSFNQDVLIEIKDRFLYTKRKYLGSAGISINTHTFNNNPYTNNYQSSNTSFNSIVVSNQGNTINTIHVNNSFNNPICNDNFKNNSITSTPINNLNGNFNMRTPKYNTPQLNNSFRKLRQTSYRSVDTYNNNNNNTTINLNQTIINEKLLLKIKDERRILAFLTNSQTFKEKVFSDNSNFRSNMTNESDITQLNLHNKLYILTGKKYNKTYYYDYSTNAIYYLCTTLSSHYYGSMIYSPTNNSIYLIGGNNTTKCEVYQLSSNYILSEKTITNEWKEIPELNEERQEFGSLYMNNCIYIFFGFSPRKGYNLSSIERYNVENTESNFELIDINENIKLSSIACAKYNENDILLLGGFDGRKYVDTSLVFNIKDQNIKKSNLVIPNINKHFQFLFQKESAFVNYDGCQVLFDMKNNAHVISHNTYEVFSEKKNK